MENQDSKLVVSRADAVAEPNEAALLVLEFLFSMTMIPVIVAVAVVEKQHLLLFAIAWDAPTSFFLPCQAYLYLNAC